MPTLTIRSAVLDDLPTIAACRRAMFADMGEGDVGELDAMVPAFAVWARTKMEQGDYYAWLAEADGVVIASVGLWLMEWSPVPHALSTRRGRVMDVYTHPDYRRRGLARQLMAELLAWSRAHGLKVISLDASAMGRGLYDELGFQATNEMVLRLEEQDTNFTNEHEFQNHS